MEFNPSQLAEELKPRLSEALHLTSSDRTENSFYLQAPERVEEDKILDAINSFLDQQGYATDPQHHGSVLILGEERCLGWVTITNFSGQDPYLIMITVTKAPRRQ